MNEIAVSRQVLASAARALARAGRWRDAAVLLAAAPPGDPVLALAAVDVALESDWFAGTDTAGPHLATATALAAGLDDAGRWDLDFLRLRHTYRTQLMAFRTDPSDNPPRDEPDTNPPRDEPGGNPAGADPGGDPAHDEVRRHATGLAAAAPDPVRRGWAEMYLGLIADNLHEDRAAAPAHYLAALRAAEPADGGTPADPMLIREALRHLGDHDHDRGDHPLALTRWRRATEVGAAAGTVAGTLSQQLLLAVLARDAGDEAGATALAAEVARWAAAIGATGIAGQATEFLAGVDPTAPPPAPTTAPDPARP